MLNWITTHQFFIDITLISTLLVMSIFVVFHAGVFSLGSVALMAIGAYTSAVLTTQHGAPIAVGIVAGAAAATVGGAVMGLIVVRLNGIYLALATFALSEATIVVIRSLKVTHGVEGIIGIPYYVSTWTSIGLLAALGVILQLIHRSYIGRAFRSARLDDVVARGIGIPVRSYKVAAMAASGTLAGLAGALNAHEVGVISPDQYNFNVLVIALTYVVVGGVSYWVGPMIAALVLGLVHEILRGHGTDVEQAVYGGMLVILMLVAPLGLGDPRLARLLRRRPRRHPPDGPTRRSDELAPTPGVGA